MYRAIFFDLDGTLLGMNQHLFLKYYFKGLFEFCTKNHLDGQKVMESIEMGTMAMIQNDGRQTNETVFWQTFCKETNYAKDFIEPLLDEFYKSDFLQAKESCFFKKEAIEIIQILKDKGYPLYLTTNAIFPKIAVFERLKWAQLNPSDFEYITTYENSHYCKPNPLYYQEVIQRFHLNPKEILMIGNDALEDGIIQSLGADCYLLKDSLLNEKHLNNKIFKCTNIDELLLFVQNLPDLK